MVNLKKIIQINFRKIFEAQVVLNDGIMFRDTPSKDCARNIPFDFKGDDGL